MNSFAFSVSMPPSSNNMFATDFKTKRRFVSKDYSAWRKREKPALEQAWKRCGSPAFERHLSLQIHLGLNYRSDIDGRVKAICDLLTATIPGFPDDRYIDCLTVQRIPTMEGARVLIMQGCPPTGEGA